MHLIPIELRLLLFLPAPCSPPLSICTGAEGLGSCFFFFLNFLFMTESAFQPSLGLQPAFAKGISFSAAREEAPINGQVPSRSRSLRVGIVGAQAFLSQHFQIKQGTTSEP